MQIIIFSGNCRVFTEYLEYPDATPLISIIVKLFIKSAFIVSEHPVLLVLIYSLLVSSKLENFLVTFVAFIGCQVSKKIQLFCGVVTMV